MYICSFSIKFFNHMNLCTLKCKDQQYFIFDLWSLSLSHILFDLALTCLIFYLYTTLIPSLLFNYLALVCVIFYLYIGPTFVCLKSWLLYYSMPVFRGMLPPVYLAHYSLLVTYLHLLSSNSESTSIFRGCI